MVTGALVVDDLKYIAAGIVAMAVAGIGLWVRYSRARKQVSNDSVHVRSDESRIDWIATLERQVEVEQRRREISEATERAMFELLQEERRRLAKCELAIRFRDERIARLEARVQRLVELATELRPDLRPWLESAPVGFDDVELEFKTTQPKGD